MYLMNDLDIIRNRIYEIRGQRVMLDRDLAELYGVETRALNQAVKRNMERFPEDFMFQLTRGEMDIWKSQNVTSNISDNQEDVVLISQNVTSKPVEKRGGTQKLPYAFTELGVAMLSSVLKSPLAIQTNINIMRAFVSFRKVVSLVNKEELVEVKKEIVAYINEILEDQNDINEENRVHLELIDQALAELQVNQQALPPRRPIGFVIPKEEK